MRLIVHGQQAYGKSVLEAILDKGVDEVVAVYCEPDREGKPVDPIKNFALEKGLPVHQPANFDDQAALDQLASFNADLEVEVFRENAESGAERGGSLARCACAKKSWLTDGQAGKFCRTRSAGSLAASAS